jgi:hypothetical protein
MDALHYLSNQQKLTPTEESVLLQQILDIDNHGQPPTTMIIREMADLLLSEHVKSMTVQPLKVGKHWVHTFIQRHPQIKSKYN